MRKLLLATALLMAVTTTADAQTLVSENVFKDITLLKRVRDNFKRPSPAGSKRKAGKPVAFYIGDSTMRTLSSGDGWNGQWGFGMYAQEFFDQNELVVENHALGGTSSVTYYDNEWPAVKAGIQAGDYVVMSFGHNDKSGDDFAAHLRLFVNETRALGATPIICSRTPRCSFSNGQLGWDTNYRPRGMAVATEMGVSYVDLEGVANPLYTDFGEWKTTQFFEDGRLHTTLLGAWHMAYCHAKAIEADTSNPLRQYLKDMTTPKLDIDRTGESHHTFEVGGSDTSSRDTYRSGRWALIYNTLEPGDTVLLAFGKTELSSKMGSKELGSIESADEKREVIQMQATNRNELVYSYGWYIHYFLNDIKAKGAIGVLINDEGVTPQQVAEWNTQLASRHGVELRQTGVDTAVRTLKHDSAADQPTFTLTGQRADRTHHGRLFIRQGRVIFQ